MIKEHVCKIRKSLEERGINFMPFLAKKSDDETALEQSNRKTALQAAVEGIVLLENDGVLPLDPQVRRIALFGSGARKTVKGGTGSGDVNERSCVNVETGLEQAGYEIVTKDWLDAYDRVWEQDRIDWKEELAQIAEERNISFTFAYLQTLHLLPTKGIEETELAEADVAVYVIARRSGEGCDRVAESGDYYLAEEEKAGLLRLRESYEKVIVVLNAGGPVDTAWMNEYVKPSALLVLSQAGMEGGTALAGILSGRYTPSGRLSDTWAMKYEDYPEAEKFSVYGGNPEEVYYREGIYVGYRYFETAGKAVSYPFGYGRSYTTFSAVCRGHELSGGVTFHFEVTNTGDYPGKEVIQIYLRAPEGKLSKPVRVLTGFAKTKLLLPGETAKVSIHCPLETFASYDELTSREILEAGKYIFYAGSNVADASAVLCLHLAKELCLHQYGEVMRPVKDVGEWTLKRELETVECTAVILTEEQTDDLYSQWLAANGQKESYAVPERVKDRIASAPDEDLIRLVVGAAPEDMRSQVGNSSIDVPGAAGQTSDCIDGIPTLVMADGGSGLRLLHHFQTDEEGHVLETDAMAGLERGAFAKPTLPRENAEDYYQYCTAFPIGTMLAQTWDEEICTQIGEAVGREMQEFGVHIWLAPSINIHRNPLCGRNFEYYSEDPLLAGQLAAAVTLGVQSVGHTSVTIKHFAANNQEFGRLGSDSIVSERALREIYLKAFERIVKKAHPLALMTSYNKINGTQSANREDLCTQVARREWGFDGLIMTDWGTTDFGSDPVQCVQCGNDLIMPGGLMNREKLTQALEQKCLTREQLETAAIHIAGVVARLR